MQTGEILLSGLMAVIIPFLAYKKNAFTLAAASAAVALLALISLAGIKWLILIVLTFLLLIVAEKIVKKTIEKENIDDISKKTGARDLVQLGANGGAALICVLLYMWTKEQMFMCGYVTAIAEAFGDSMASSIGSTSRGKTINLATLEEMPSGLSGGVSFCGSVACCLSCFAITLIALVLGLQTWHQLMISFICSTAGCFLDSLMGATIQVKYKCKKCGKVTEKEKHCDEQTEYFSGKPFIDNDIVNISSNFFAATFAILFLAVFNVVPVNRMLEYTALFVLMLAVASLLHEIGHMIGCAIWKCTILSVKCGFINYDFSSKKISLRFKGKNNCAFSSNNKSRARMVYLSGPIMNGFLAVVALIWLLLSPALPWGFFLIANCLKFVFNLIPSKNTDGYMAFVVLRGAN